VGRCRCGLAAIIRPQLINCDVIVSLAVDTALPWTSVSSAGTCMYGITGHT
jgi:hypothetical protein